MDKMRGEKTPEDPWWRFFRSQNSPRESQEINCLKLFSQEWVAVEMNAAFATNDGNLIYALCISSALFPIVFQLSSSKVKKLTALQMKFCFPIPDCNCFWQPVFAYCRDSHRLISILALRICIRLLNVQGHSEWIPIDILKTLWVLRAFRDFINWLVQIRRNFSEPPLAATATALWTETRFRRVT